MELVAISCGTRCSRAATGALVIQGEVVLALCAYPMEGGGSSSPFTAAVDQVAGGSDRDGVCAADRSGLSIPGSTAGRAVVDVATDCDGLIVTGASSANPPSSTADLCTSTLSRSASAVSFGESFLSQSAAPTSTLASAGCCAGFSVGLGCFVSFSRIVGTRYHDDKQWFQPAGEICLADRRFHQTRPARFDADLHRPVQRFHENGQPLLLPEGGMEHPDA